MSSDYRLLKRLLDVAIASFALVLLAPVLLVIAAAIVLDNPGPVFYVHQRVGQFGRPFPFFKFRTMVVGADRIGYEIDGAADRRITRIGRFLRRWHLDELPQLLNVLRGEMSIVGPRPTLQYQVDVYTPEQRRRLLVPPGLTGLAQVSGLNSLTWPEKIRIDVEYVEKASLRLDLEIMLRTFGVLAKGENTYGHGWESSKEKKTHDA
ncbi:MAG: sugar transferase [Armatimonadetes bacterium]|nr:sugar transferase [Armatimonadota bacterium]